MVTDKIYDVIDSIPKEGLDAGEVVARYDLKDTLCDDENECLMIVDKRNVVNANPSKGDIIELKDTPDPNSIELELERTEGVDKIGNVILKTTIGENDSFSVKYFNFYVIYNVNGNWRYCSDMKLEQKGIECSCENLKITDSSSGKWNYFPYAGTHGEWISYASGDTGIYVLSAGSGS